MTDPTLKSYIEGDHTEQQVFDFVHAKILKQGIPSIGNDSGNGCAYRGNNGAKCAIGHLIPDELYNTSIERYGVANLVSMLDEINYFKHTTLDYTNKRLFLAKLQNAHDLAFRYTNHLTENSFCEYFMVQMKHLADETELKYSL